MISQNFNGETNNLVIQNHVTIQGNVANVRSKDPQQTVKEISGYVNNVSPEREGKTGKYFECQIKVGQNQYKQCYVWSPGKRRDFMDIQNKKKAIRLRKIKSFGENISFDQHSFYEETINKTIEPDMETINESTVRPIEGLDKVPPEQIISAKAKVIDVYNIESAAGKNGSSINKQDLVIADQKSKIKMVLWGDQCRYGVKRDKTYIFKKFRLKRKNGETYLTTPKNSTLSSIEEIYDIEKMDKRKLSFVEDVLFVMLFFWFSLTIISLN